MSKTNAELSAQVTALIKEAIAKHEPKFMLGDRDVAIFNAGFRFASQIIETHRDKS